MIPRNIAREHVIKAMQEIDKQGVPDSRLSHDYYLKFNGKEYPPKYVISLANKFVNENELDPKGFNGGEEANGFLESRGFEIFRIEDSELVDQKTDFADNLRKYLENTFLITVTKNRNHLILPSGAAIHVRGSKVLPNHRGFYYLLEEDYKDTITNPNGYFSVVFGTTSSTFVFPPERLKGIFEGQPLTQTEGNKPKWYFDVIRVENKYYLKLHKGAAEQYEIDDCLNKWEQIPELAASKAQSPNSKPEDLEKLEVENEYVFVTGYDDTNLEKSKKHQILGWVKNSNYLSEGSLVFVFNRTTLLLDSCFIIKSKSDNIDDLIWSDEIQSNKVIYPNRWNAELVKEGIDIPLTDINKISPFDEEPFQGLLRGNFPMPLNSPQNRDKYEKFRSFLLNFIQSAVNYWIFVVTDQESLSAEEIYRTRMEDKFWGLNERTPYRKHLKKGDKVIFSNGSKAFLGTALLDSDSFELDENQRRKFSREDVFKTSYGVMLSNIVAWHDPKKVDDYVDYISFITNKEQYPVYFQGGIKKILGTEYDIITKGAPSDQHPPLRETSLWLVRAGDNGQGEQIALEKNLVGIGYGGLPRLDSVKEFKAFKEYFIQSHPNDSPARVGQVVPQIWSFMYDIKKGDLVVLPLKTQDSKQVAVGQIIGDYKYEDLNSEIKQFRPVKWFKIDTPRNEFDPDINGSLDSRGTVYHIGGSSAVKKIKIMLDRLGIDTSNIDEVSPYTSIEAIAGAENLASLNGISLEYNRSWLSLTHQEITQIAEQVLRGQSKKLEIEDSVIRRIISHLILSKHVILVGPPGTGKTDLARRLLRELGIRLLGKSEPIERVASYEWGRYEVIGGISISPDSKGDSFHLGCVTHAIKEAKLLLIDEFNRADMNKAFGEMFLAMDHGAIQLKENENPSGFIYKSPNEIEIPSNFRMICTMNDYDKSLLNELSYGLLRRFAFVEIEVPNDKKKVKDIVIERAKRDLSELDDRVLERSASNIEEQIDKFIDFLLAIREKRQIGISSYIDVIRYVLFGVSITDDNPWKIMNDALIDYVIPQFDRLDFDTLDFAYKSAVGTFKDEKGFIPDLQPFLSTLHEKVKILQNLNKLFSSEDTT